MTEEQWLGAKEPGEMLRYLGKTASVRKRRLFACACVRHIWHLLTDPRSQRAIEVAEAFADGVVDREVVKIERRKAAGASPGGAPNRWSPASAAEICLNLTTEDISTAARAASAASQGGISLSAERAAQAMIVRDIFGNPFRSVRLDPAWLAWHSGTIRQLANTIYDGRTFDDMPILADALDDADCTDADILDHLRDPGPHVRGCWALDLILLQDG
jgi:hypothetical protein